MTLIKDLKLIDTNLVSYSLRSHTITVKYALHLTGPICISYITIAEMYAGAFSKNWGPAKIQDMEDSFSKYILLDHLPTIPLYYAKIFANQKRKGRIMSFTDAWIAATAMAYGIPLVSHNRKDFENIEGLTLISEG